MITEKEAQQLFRELSKGCYSIHGIIEVMTREKKREIQTALESLKNGYSDDVEILLIALLEGHF